MDRIELMMRMLAVNINMLLTNKILFWKMDEHCLAIAKYSSPDIIDGRIFCAELYELTGPAYTLLFVDNEQNIKQKLKFRYSEVTENPFQLYE